ncbi:MAG: hypothetical protein J5742_00570 [Alphaproteobacteria bacterium]|nr:hypothetical protein [Alphaproteobacteria bacterium]
MIRYVIALFLAVLPVVAGAADGGRDPRVGALGLPSGNRFAPAQDRAGIMSKNQLTTPDVSISTSGGVDRSPSIKADGVVPPVPVAEVKKDTREAERAACLNNNIGIGNTFVWASRYSNSGSYATLQEDTENPENNVCFVKVDIKTADSRIDVSGLPSRYFQWGETINCGSWLDEADLKQRILDAKKSGRTLATVGGAVGGAALGVGSMELFGNKLINGKVEGQKNKNLSETEVLRSQLLAMKKNNDSRYSKFVEDLKKLKAQCDQLRKYGGTSDDCDRFDYDVLLSL